MLPFSGSSRVFAALVMTLCSVGGLTGCEGKTTGDDGGGDTGAGTGSTLRACKEGDARDPIDVVTQSIENDELVLQVGHGGGCEEHSYGLCWEEAWGESEPPLVSLAVLHDAGGDGCEAYLEKELRFDLAPLGAEYEERYGSAQGKLSLSVGEESLLWSFGGGEPPTQEALLAAADALNSCEVVTDCKALSLGCDTLYVNAQADTAALEADIQSFEEARSGGPVACAAACACGVLSCTAGKCTTASGDCGAPPPDTQTVCL